jgi:3-keto-disaccharide hydrolase/FG-GAP-like repeat
MEETMSQRTVVAVAALLAMLILPVLGAGPTFRADYRFTGTNLTAFKSLGQAEWKVQNGEIVGTPKDSNGGWLLLDGKAFQDVGLYASVKCTAGCKGGILMRVAKTPDGGMKGVLMSLTEGDLASYDVTLDAQGKETKREPLAAATGGGGGGAGAGRGAAGAVPAAGRGAGAPGGVPLQPGATRGGGPAPAIPPEIAAQLPKNLAERPTGAFVPGGYNEVEILLTENSVRPKFNGGSLGRGGPAQGGIPESDADGYGQIGLYVGGTGELRVKDLMCKDLLARTWGPVETGKNFKAIAVDPHYYSWTAAAGDFNHDGIMDVAAGPYLYLGPDYKIAKQIYTPKSFNPTAEYPIPSMVSLAYDFTGDGWIDLLVMSGNAGNGTGTLYVNPQNASRLWAKYVVLQPVGNEETLMKDIDGDGKPDIIHAGNNTLRYSHPDPANPTGTWITKTISEPGPWGVNIGHGLGVGDINGDGRMDYINCYGWWEQPPPGTTGVWTMHPQAFGRWGASQGGAGGAEIAVNDVNGDKLNDIVTAMEGHGFGLAWYEQKREGSKISFVEHMIMGDFTTKNAGDVIFTEPHATAFADMDGDGLMDMVTGKRYMSHFGYTDPDPWGEPVLYLYRLVRNKQAPGGAEFVPELVHNRSGVGSHIVITDMNGDGMPDIVTSTNLGTFVFQNLRKKRVS